MILVTVTMGALLLLEVGALAMLILNCRGVAAPGKQPPREPSCALPFVSVLVPARNEERNIRDCVESLMAQDYPRFEVIVSDDRSEDRTGEILEELKGRYANLRVVRPAAPPSDWVSGKSHALWHAAHEARGEWLLFVDADMRLYPCALRAAMQYGLESEADLFSAMPGIDCVGFWERAVLPAIARLYMISAPLWKVSDPASGVVAGTGPFMLFRRSAYEAIGGHQAVKGQRVEDVELARLVKMNGLKLRFVLGTFLSHGRQYCSLREMVRGISRQYFLGLRGNAFWAVVGVVFTLGVSVVPYVALVAFATLWALEPGVRAWDVGVALALAQCGVIAACHVVLRRCYGVCGGSLLLHPVGGAMSAFIMARSTLHGLCGKAAEWRGRKC